MHRTSSSLSISLRMSTEKELFGFDIIEEGAFLAPGYDGIIWVTKPPPFIKGPQILRGCFDAASTNDESANSEISIVPIPSDGNSKRVLISPTGLIDPDYDDLRVFKEAAAKAVERALKAGFRKPMLFLEDYSEHPNSDLITLLSVLEALYVPIQVRELKPENVKTIEKLGVCHVNPPKLTNLVSLAKKLESGRRIARDIGEADPERMTPMKIREYVESQFKETAIKITVVEDEEIIKKEYPLFEAVNRCASSVNRHKGCIMYLEYTPINLDEMKETLFLVGKGVTYDTGGADIKAGGIMAGMSRDKCGAAAVAGFMKVVEQLKPNHLKITAALCLVRNSVGSNCYVADELIKARSGELVRVVNTDAEGRMIMADVLCRMKELAILSPNPQIFTVATLTGHAWLTVGDGYSIVMDNGPARKAGVGEKLKKAGDEVADLFEVSTIRKEDFKAHRGKAKGDNISQGFTSLSTKVPRGHQTPAAFLILASGLDKNGSGNAKPLKYSHLDIVASAGEFPDPATGAPILALAKMYLSF